jgi:hypothetical protein
MAADTAEISSSSSSSLSTTSTDLWNHFRSPDPNYTLALLASFTISMIGFFTSFYMTDKWKNGWADAPLWVHLMFWPFSILTIILGTPHMRLFLSNWRANLPWIFSILATVGFTVLFSQPYFQAAIRGSSH